MKHRSFKCIRTSWFMCNTMNALFAWLLVIGWGNCSEILVLDGLLPEERNFYVWPLYMWICLLCYKQIANFHGSMDSIEILIIGFIFLSLLTMLGFGLCWFLKGVHVRDVILILDWMFYFFSSWAFHHVLMEDLWKRIC